jgi:PAS domain S-box-containing protein
MHNFEDTKKLLHNSNIYYLIAVSMDSNFSYINKRYQTIFEPQHGNLIGQHYSVTMHPDDLHICQAVSMKAFMNPDQIFPAVIRKNDGKGGYVVTEWEYKAIFDSDNQPSGMFCIGHDITQYFQNSLELKDAKESLIKSMLNVEQLNYVQSHGVRKPIANILGLVDLLQGMEMDDNVREIFGMITESVQELDVLIRNTAAKG